MYSFATWSLGRFIQPRPAPLCKTVTSERFFTEALHSIILRWDLEGSLVFWYVNLSAPVTRTRLGFDYWDKALDIVFSPDLSDWRWKDEDHFEQAQRSGQISRDEAKSLRMEGVRVIGLAHDRKPPFNEGWERWRPEPHWSIPVLTGDWAHVEQAGPA